MATLPGVSIVAAEGGVNIEDANFPRTTASGLANHRGYGRGPAHTGVCAGGGRGSLYARVVSTQPCVPCW